MDIQKHFEPFKKGIIGEGYQFNTPYGKKALRYADWLASGRLYKPIEEQIAGIFGPYVGNTHTETSETGTLMTKAYHYAHHLIKAHCNAGPEDVIITQGSGMTHMVNKFQRILGLKICAKGDIKKCYEEQERPVVFITHMEHHSNHTSWFETIADVVVLKPDEELMVNPESLRQELKKYRNRKFKFGAFTAASNVTGIEPPYYELAKIMHENGGLCFVDFAASAPYVDINMHPEDPEKKLDAIFFSPHKFLGGPGSTGVLIFDRNLYNRKAPDLPGGGTVDWTNPWGGYKYIDDIEIREDGGTPAFLQTIRTALSIDLKNQMNTQWIRQRETQLVEKAFSQMGKNPRIHILAEKQQKRLGVLSFYIDNIHYNLAVKLLNDLYGIQVRGGCACAGTYGHYLLNVSHDYSNEITARIANGDLSDKPGWIRLSLHPTMTDQEVDYMLNAIDEISVHYEKYAGDYIYNKHKNEFRHHAEPEDKTDRIKEWFRLK
ncbi:MAG TPA: aminotransferase class V-fold PLP-dependent enzyme [Bacteroidales bacterium]|nr:aminotransferase class V-fold PLP-dependent enzyme [Bacteroidales bacterium]